MAKMKKNTAGQVLFTMVDNVDFASIRSNLVMASLTCTVYGVKHGGSVAAHVLAASKAASIVRSGLYRWPLKSTEISDADQITVYITAAAGQSAADQILQYEVEDITTADISDMVSDIKSYLIALSAQLSDVYSTVRGISDSVSDVRSFLTGLSDELSNVYSTVRGISDIVSDTRSIMVALSAELSNIQSLVTGGSDTLSKIYAHTTGLSDIVSNVYVQTTGASDVLSRLGSASNIASVGWV